MVEQNFAGQVAIVTGGGSGIGRAVAESLALRGAAVVVSDIAFDHAQAATDGIVASGGRALAVGADVASAAAVDAMMAAGEREFGREFGVASILINNAGIREIEPFVDLDDATWNRVVGVNLTGPFLCSRGFAKRLITAERGGVIVNVASVAGLTGLAERSAYVSSKHGLVGLTKATAMELGPHGIRVVAVAPGGVMTALQMGQDLGSRAATYPLRRMAEAKEIADVIVFLASSEASFITGSVVTVDGGLTAGTFRPKQGQGAAASSS